MTIEEFWKRLEAHGVVVPHEIRSRIGLELSQERVMIRPPLRISNKARVLGYGSGVSSTFIARELGITVRQVQKIRKLVRL